MSPSESMERVLGRIEGKLDGIVAQLAAMATRADGHEQRLQTLEQESATRAAYVPRLIAVEAQADDNERRINTIESTASAGVRAATVVWTVAAALGSAALTVALSYFG